MSTAIFTNFTNEIYTDKLLSTELYLGPYGSDRAFLVARVFVAIQGSVAKLRELYGNLQGVPPLTRATNCSPVAEAHGRSTRVHVVDGVGVRSNTINDLLRRLELHTLSITLLATTAYHNGWDYDRLTKEWGTRSAQVLRMDYDKSLAATIELSLAPPTFRKLGPNGRNLLGVVEFFPQDVDEKYISKEWLHHHACATPGLS